MRKKGEKSGDDIFALKRRLLFFFYKKCAILFLIWIKTCLWMATLGLTEEVAAVVAAVAAAAAVASTGALHCVTVDGCCCCCCCCYCCRGLRNKNLAPGNTKNLSHSWQQPSLLLCVFLCLLTVLAAWIFPSPLSILPSSLRWKRRRERERRERGRRNTLLLLLLLLRCTVRHVSLSEEMAFGKIIKTL